MIYLDNAATSFHKPRCVIDAVVSAMESFGNSGRSVHGGALDASRTIYACREKLSQMFHCRPDHVVFTANSSEALNIANHGVLGVGDHAITTDCEHNSVLRPLYRHGDVSYVKSDTQGCVKVSDFAELIQENTKAIVCTHGSNLTGNILPIAEIGALAHEKGLLFIVDASQTAGVFPIDMEQMHIDILCFTGHKSLLGPQGTGGLCIAEGVEIATWKVGGTGVQTYLETQPPQYPTRLEAGTLNSHGIAGLYAALQYIEQQGIDTLRCKEQELARRFYEGVCALDGVTVYGDFSTRERAPIVTLNIRDYDSGQVSDVLSERYDIATRSGAHCAPRMHRALGTEERGAVRFSFGHGNTEEEVDAAIAAVKEIAE